MRSAVCWNATALWFVEAYVGAGDDSCVCTAPSALPSVTPASSVRCWRSLRSWSATTPRVSRQPASESPPTPISTATDTSRKDGRLREDCDDCSATLTLTPFGTGYDDTSTIRSIRPAMLSEGNG